MGLAWPVGEVVAECVVELVERVCTVEEWLVLCDIVGLGFDDVEVKGSEFDFGESIEFACGGEEASAIGFGCALFVDDPKFDGEPVDASESFELFGGGDAFGGLPDPAIDIGEERVAE